MPIDFAPATERDEIAQNIRTILSTMRGTVPYLRGFGVGFGALDMPLGAVPSRLSPELKSAISTYEPRATISDITCALNALMDGSLTATVRMT